MEDSDSTLLPQDFGVGRPDLIELDSIEQEGVEVATHLCQAFGAEDELEEDPDLQNELTSLEQEVGDLVSQTFQFRVPSSSSLGGSPRYVDYFDERSFGVIQPPQVVPSIPQAPRRRGQTQDVAQPSQNDFDSLIRGFEFA